jgi:urease beta subunit
MGFFPALFKGAAPGTHWHANDARLSGFMAAANRPHTTNAVLGHITHYSHPSPYISLSFSFAVARGYALDGPTGTATATNPGYVYEVDLSASVGGPPPLDTLLEIAKAGHVHKHNGDQRLLLGIADPASGPALLTAVPLPGGRTATPTVSQALQALVLAARDAEVLLSSVSAGCVVQRHSVY